MASSTVGLIIVVACIAVAIGSVVGYVWGRLDEMTSGSESEEEDFLDE